MRDSKKEIIWEKEKRKSLGKVTEMKERGRDKGRMREERERDKEYE